MSYSATQPLADVMWSYQEEFNAFMLGDFLGEGVYRRVYAFAFDPENYVVKLSKFDQDRHFCNVMEWQLWNGTLQHKTANAWLAPCRAISRSGNVLVQRRTKPCLPGDIPKRIPEFLDDTHDKNFGWLDGRIVCHDYAFYHHELRKPLPMIARSQN